MSDTSMGPDRSPSEPSTRLWFVAKVKPNAERQIETYLARFGVSVYAPEIVASVKGQRRTEPLFPGYVFIHIDPMAEKWSLTRWAPGLLYFLPERTQPLPVPASLIAEIGHRVERWNQGSWANALRPKDGVVIQSGPLRGLDAIFERYLPGRQRCTVLVSLMGHLRRVQVDLGDVVNLRILRRNFAASY